ncbi:MAG: response regulator transcription factor [Eubacterium sp.]|nr:response regulator transcription factor [Eubacterium sp.]
MKILVAEDEEGMQYAITTALHMSGYETDSALNGLEAVEMASKNAYDCMLFDVMMPQMDGIEALKKIRASGNVCPVIMLTAKSQVDDRVIGLDAGADDYLSKPFSMKELIARVRSQLRRSDKAYTPRKLSIGNITLDLEQQELSSENGIRLAKKETRLLEYLILNRDKTLSTDEIYAHVWDDEPEIEKDVVWVYISYLRQKLISVNANVAIVGEQGADYSITEAI